MVIVITGRLDEDLRSRTLKAGAVGFLYKPFSEQDLANGILAALNTKEDDFCR
jgi:FixJ family two-component response regulator